MIDRGRAIRFFEEVIDRGRAIRFFEEVLEMLKDES